MSANQLLVKHVVQCNDMQLAKAFAAMDVWLRRIAAVLKADQMFPEAMPSEDKDRYVLIREGCLEQTGHCHFEYKQD